MKIRVPGGVPPGRQAAMLAVVSHCAVHHALRHAPDITIELE
jgi:putative redox protein